MTSERFLLTIDSTELTIVDATANDAGVYEVKFEGILVYPYSMDCVAETLAFLRQYPILSPASFELFIGELKQGVCTCGDKSKKVIDLYCVSE